MAVAVSAMLGVVFLIFTAFVYTMRFLRRRARRSDPPERSVAFDQVELHRLLETGSISPEEFERLKTVMARQREQSQPPPTGARGFEVLPPKPPAD